MVGRSMRSEVAGSPLPTPQAARAPAAPSDSVAGSARSKLRLDPCLFMLIPFRFLFPVPQAVPRRACGLHQVIARWRGGARGG